MTTPSTVRTKIGKTKDIDSAEKLLRSLGPQGELVIEKFKDVKPLDKRFNLYIAGARLIKQELSRAMKYKELPVDIDTFVLDSRYLNMPLRKKRADGEWEGEIYPKVMDELRAICTGDYVEVVLTGGIGSAKTSTALILMAYQLYLISILRDPHKEFGLMKSSEIVFVFQSLNASTAKTVDFMRFKSMIDHSKYFRAKFDYDRNVESELRFPNRVIVRPIAGTSTGAIGQNTINALIDEINFMAVTDKSKQSREKGTHDQAWENYNSLVRRRKSRFMKQGKLPGLFLLVSSKRYPGEFTDVKIEEARTNKQIYIYDKRTWEIAPEGTFSGKTFRLFTGDLIRKPRILAPHDKVPKEDERLVMEIPEEFRSDFEQDILSALRDIAGVATMALAPFIIEIEKVAKCFGKRSSILSSDTCDFVTSQLQILPNRFMDKDQPRFVHVDLALTGDVAGVACGYVPGFMPIKRSEDSIEVLPIINMDFTLGVPAPPNAEIDFSKIRTLLYKLKELGLNIKWVSYDGWNSADSLQILRRKGFSVGVQSMDRTMVPYEVAKTALMDNRVNAPADNKCYMEYISLELDAKKGKVDHPAQNGCFTGDTHVLLANGSTARFDSLINTEQEIITFDGFSFKRAGAINPRVTKYTDMLVDIEFEDGQHCSCTPEHLFMVEDGSWVRAEDLTVDTKLKSFFSK